MMAVGCFFRIEGFISHVFVLANTKGIMNLNLLFYKFKLNIGNACPLVELFI